MEIIKNLLRGCDLYTSTESTKMMFKKNVYQLLLITFSFLIIVKRENKNMFQTHDFPVNNLNNEFYQIN